jgi:hypothetical protein
MSSAFLGHGDNLFPPLRQLLHNAKSIMPPSLHYAPILTVQSLKENFHNNYINVRSFLLGLGLAL